MAEHFRIAMRRRFHRRPYRTLAVCLAMLIAVLAKFWGAWDGAAGPSPLAEGTHRVVRVIDGDTIILAPHTTVRLIGVDTPETVKPEHPVEPWGPEATQFTRQFVSGGSVQLTFDRERVDRFGRYLAYVWVDGELLNEALVRAGLARFEAHFHYSEAMKRRFRQAQREAQQANLGIWSSGQWPVPTNSPRNL